MRLAGVDDRAAKLFIATGQRSGAIDERLTPMDDDVGIGADHDEAPGGDRPQLQFIVGRRFDLILSQPGAKHILGVFESNEPGPPTVASAAAKRLKSRAGPM